jgi:KaiC/GvpD/RAD55 family RecA-like ATPase
MSMVIRKGVKMGIPQFDELISFMPGQFTTVTGIPGSGKSEFVDWMMCSSRKIASVAMGNLQF